MNHFNIQSPENLEHGLYSTWTILLFLQHPTQALPDIHILIISVLLESVQLPHCTLALMSVVAAKIYLEVLRSIISKACRCIMAYSPTQKANYTTSPMF